MSDIENRRSGYSIFCDDIRQELNNKTSYIGTYNGEMNVFMPFPATLPKFCISAFYNQPVGDEPQVVKIRVIMRRQDEEKVLLEGAIPEEAFRNAPPTNPLFDNPLILANTVIILSPFTIEHECVLKVRAYYGDEEIKMGSIAIRSKPVSD